ncbi:dTDP-4-amino-4,6-dideoxy-D-galactose acyltransferase [Flavobacteriaceae bacterium UJ101]|nr:dTDP-4-amino-4,6-dideoxy-D-galactose acyltransferase [Flavobacteriaceae bacterium UJ101]
MIERLDWDSNFFKINIGKKKVLKSLFYSSFNIEEDWDLIYIFDESDKQEQNRKFIKEKFNIDVIDVKRIYRINNLLKVELEDKYIVEEKNISNDLITLVYKSGEFSRFKLDFNLRYKFEEMYSVWLNHYFKGSENKKIYVWKEKNIILGFIAFTVNKDKGIIDLIAVKDEARNKGIASSLIKRVQKYLYTNKILELTVATQRDNIPACKLYEKNLFTSFEDTYIYHYWIKK